MRKEAASKKKDVFRVATLEQGETVYREFPRQEVQAIAELIGFDLDLDTPFLWFLKQVLMTLLPKGWKRESCPWGQVCYFNQTSGVTTETHPLLFRYRTAFLKLLRYRLLRRSDPGLVAEPEDSEREPSAYEQLQFTSLISLQTPPSPLLQSALKDSEEFYSSLVSYEAPSIPAFLESSALYQQADPVQVRDTAKKLGIQYAFKLYWLARLTLALPLPPGWEQVRDSYGEKRYMAYSYNVVVEESPALAFMQKLVSRAMYGGNVERPTMMRFYDKHMMPYVVDLAALGMGERTYRLQTENLHYIREIRSKDMYHPNTCDWTDTVQGLLLVHLAVCAGVNFSTELHLLGAVDRFIRSCKKQGVFKMWAFRVLSQGQFYWFNESEDRAYSSFPYVKSIRRFVEKRRKKVEKRLEGKTRERGERHDLFERFGEAFTAEIATLAVKTMQTYLESWVEEEASLSKPTIYLSSVLDPAVSLFTPLNLLYSNPYRLSGLSFLIDKDDKDARLSSDSETEAGTTLAWETVTRVVKSEDKPKSGGLFKNKKLLKAKTEFKRKMIRSRTFKPPQERGSGSLALPPRARSSQELSAPISLIEEYGESSGTPSSEDSESDAVFSEEERPNLAEVAAEQESNESAEEKETEEKQGDIPPERSTELIEERVVPPDQLTGLTKEPENHQEIISPPIEVQNSIEIAVPPLPCPVSTPPAKEEKTESVTDRSQHQGSSRGAPSGVSSRASKRLAPSRTNSRPGTGLLLAGQQPLLPETVRTLKREPTRHWPLLPANPTPRNSNTGETLPPLRDAGNNPLEDSPTMTPDKPLSPLSPLTPSVSSRSLHDSLSPAGHNGSLSRSQTRTGLLPQFPLPPLVPIAETKPEHSSKQDANNKANRELFGQFSNAVVGSFLTIVESAQEKKEPEAPQEASKDVKREEEESKVQLTNWLASKDVITGLGKLFLPVIKAPVPELSLPPVHRNTQVFLPIVYHSDSLSISAGESSPVPRKSVLMPGQRRESFIMSESVSLLKVPVSLNRRASMLGRRSSILPSPEPKVASLSKDFVLSPGQKSEAPVFITPAKPAVPLTTQRVQDFLHYLDVVGFPMSTQAEVKSYPAKQEILPMHVIKMGKRLGMKVTSQKYNSAESDLLWIALLQLTAPSPCQSRLGLPQQVAMLPFKSHPGDEFFLLMSDFNRKLRARELDQLSKPEKVKSLVSESWLCLTTRLNIPYLYNFLTGERIALKKAQATLQELDLSKDKRIAMLRAALEEQLV